MVVQKCHASLVPTDTGVNVGNSTADRTTVARVNFEHAVGAAWDSLSAEQVEPIWNTGFWKCIFGNDSLGDALIQQVKRSMPSGDYAGGEPGDADKRLRVDSPQTFSAPLFQTCVKSTDDISWHEKCEALLQKSFSYVTAVNSIQSDGGLQECLKILLKGASIQSRHLTTWGEVRDAIAKQAKKRMFERKLEQLKKGDSDPGAFERHYNEIYEKLGCEEGSTYEFLQPELANTQGDVACEKVVIAIPRQPLDFVQRAVEVGHPPSIAIQLPPSLQEVMAWNRDAGAFEIYKHRIDFVKHWTHLQQILKGKKLALWQEIGALRLS